VVKQADLVFALYLCGDHFDLAQKRRDFAYYEPITVRDSSLSASVQAIVAAEIGELELAYDYFRETALIDLHDLAGNTVDGLHLAALGGAWLVAVAGFGGLRDSGDVLAFAPRLPPALSRICFRLLYRDRCLRVDITRGQVRYEVLSGEPLELLHEGTPLSLAPGAPQVCACHVASDSLSVEPPPGRAPSCQGVGADANDNQRRLPLSG
jgi:alpha,alpha-trehalose phosphorylase